MVTLELKNLSDIEIFKSEIRKWGNQCNADVHYVYQEYTALIKKRGLLNKIR